MSAGSKARALRERAPLVCGAAALILSAGVAAPAQPPPSPASAAALLSGSEISVIESGGIAGRVHSARLVATDGRVAVEYRPPDARASSGSFSGTIESDRYIALWRELENASAWGVASPQPMVGSDIVSVELRIRIGESARSVRWDTVREQQGDIRRVAEAARRVLAAARDSAFTR